MSNLTAKLVLEDGTIYYGESFGFNQSISGEVVFSTGMVGYPESLTDPSYSGQILTLTFPLIGNYGVPGESENQSILENFESTRIQIQGLLVSEYSEQYQHYSAKKSLKAWLIEHKIPALTNIDTRSLTQHIRNKGTMLGKIIISDKDIPFFDPNKVNLLDKVTVKEKLMYGKGKYKIMLVDCGLKNNILRLMLKRDVTVIRVPYDYDYTAEEFDGVFVSNGPGDPVIAIQTISILQKVMAKNKPIFGICLGHQLLALAAGAKTYKLKYGHRSQNQPCISDNGNCVITSQNHGYEVDMKTLGSDWTEFYTNLNDNSNEGIIHTSKPFFSVQFHPEGSSGPQDTESLFDKFIEMVKAHESN